MSLFQDSSCRVRHVDSHPQLHIHNLTCTSIEYIHRTTIISSARQTKPVFEEVAEPGACSLDLVTCVFFLVILSIIISTTVQNADVSSSTAREDGCGRSGQIPNIRVHGQGTISDVVESSSVLIRYALLNRCAWLLSLIHI